MWIDITLRSKLRSRVYCRHSTHKINSVYLLIDHPGPLSHGHYKGPTFCGYRSSVLRSYPRRSLRTIPEMISERRILEKVIFIIYVCMRVSVYQCIYVCKCIFTKSFIISVFCCIRFEKNVKFLWTYSLVIFTYYIIIVECVFII